MLFTPVRKGALARTALVLKSSISALLGLAVLSPGAMATDGSWTQTAAGTQVWATGTNWLNGIVADGVDGNAILNTDLTADQNISLGAGGRTIGNLFVQDPTIGTAGGFGIGVAGDGGLTLDVSTGRSLIDLSTLAAGKKLSFAVPIISADGVLKTGGGQLTLRADSVNFTGDLVAAGGLSDTRSTYANMSALQILNGATFQEDFVNNGGTNIANFINVNATLKLGGVMAIPPLAVPPTLPLVTSGFAFGSATFTLTGKAGSVNAQSFANTQVNAGFATINSNTGAAGTVVNLSLGNLTRTVGGIVNFAVPATGTSTVTTTTANTGNILGGWALWNGADWATVTGGTIGALPAGSYTAGVWSPGTNTDVTASFGAVTGSTQSVRFNTAVNTVVTLTAPATITSGGILITPTVAASTSQITGSTLTSSSGDLIITNNATGLLTIASTIVESGGPLGLTKAGTGAATLSSATTALTGPLNVMNGTLSLAGNFAGVSAVNIGAGGTLQMGTGGLSGTIGNLTINNNGVYAINRSDNSTLTNPVTGTGGLTKSGTGVLTLVNTLPWTGPTLLNAGALALAADNVLPTGNFRFNTANATLRSADANLRTIPNFFDIATDSVFGSATTGDLLLTGTFATGNGAKILTINNATTTVSGLVTGGASVNLVTKAGPGTLVLTNAGNTLNRPFAINAGTLQISSESNLGVNQTTAAANNLQFAGGTLRTTATFTIDDSSRGITLATGGGTFNTDLSTTLTVANVIAGPGTLTKTGNGTLLLTNANTYTGATAVQTGTLMLGASSTIASSISLEPRAGATLDVSSQPAFGLGNNQTLLGAGTLLGNVTVGAGTSLAPGPINSVGTLSVTGNVLLTGGQLVYNLGANNTPGGAFNDLLSVTGDLSFAGTTPLQISPVGLLAGSYRLINYTGVLSGGAANLSAAVNNSRYTFTPDFSTAGQVNLTVVGSAANLTWAGDGSANLWDFNNSANWNANTEKFFQQDVVTFDDSTIFTTVALNSTVTPTATKFDTAGSYLLFGSGKISGLGSLTKSGDGTVTISTANDLAGATTITAGTMILDAVGTLGTGPVSIVGGTLALVTSGTSNTGAITVGPSGTLRFDGAGTDTRNVTDNGTIAFNNAVILSGAISGTGGLAATFNGAMQLAGTTANTFSGLTTVSAGTLALNKTAGVNAVGGNMLITGGTVSWSAADQVADTASITITGGTFTTGNRADVIANLTISTGTLVTFSGLTVTGTTSVTTGVHDIANSNGVFSTGTLVLSGFSNSRMGANGGPSTVSVGAGGLSMTNATLQFGQGGTPAQTATLNLAGDVTLSGNNLFDVNTGNPVSTINLGNASRTFLVSDGTTTIEPSIVSATASAGITKTGNGVLVLAPGTNTNGASTYTGDTLVNAGTLQVNGSLSGTNVTVTGATLEGVGTITTGLLGLTLNTGGKLAPGTSFSIGTLTVSGGVKIGNAVTDTATAALKFDLSVPGSSDQVVLPSGALNIGANVLEFDDFAFTSFGGIFDGATYVLFDGNTQIVGTLGAGINGNLDGLQVQLQFADNGKDLVLAAIPEPGAVTMLLGGLAMVGLRRRKRA